MKTRNLVSEKIIGMGTKPHDQDTVNGILDTAFSTDKHLNTVDENQQTAVMHAAKFHNVEALNWLLKYHLMHKTKLELLCQDPSTKKHRRTGPLLAGTFTEENEAPAAESKVVESAIQKQQFLNLQFSALTFAINHADLDEYAPQKGAYALRSRQATKLLLDENSPIRDDDITAAIQAGNLWFLSCYFQNYHRKYKLPSFGTNEQWQNAISLAIEHGKGNIAAYLLSEKGKQDNQESCEHWHHALAHAVLHRQHDVLVRILTEKKSQKLTFHEKDELLDQLLDGCGKTAGDKEQVAKLALALLEHIEIPKVRMAYSKNDKLLRFAIETNNEELLAKMVENLELDALSKLNFLGRAALMIANAHHQGKLDSHIAKNLVIFIQRKNDKHYEGRFQYNENASIVKRIDLADALIDKDQRNAQICWDGIHSSNALLTEKTLCAELLDFIKGAAPKPQESKAAQSDAADIQAAARTKAFATSSTKLFPAAVSRELVLKFSSLRELYQLSGEAVLWKTNSVLGESVKQHALKEMETMAAAFPAFAVQLKTIQQPMQTVQAKKVTASS